MVVPSGDCRLISQNAERVGVWGHGDLHLLEEVEESVDGDHIAEFLVERTNVRHESRCKKHITSDDDKLLTKVHDGLIPTLRLTAKGTKQTKESSLRAHLAASASAAFFSSMPRARRVSLVLASSVSLLLAPRTPKAHVHLCSCANVACGICGCPNQEPDKHTRRVSRTLRVKCHDTQEECHVTRRRESPHLTKSPTRKKSPNVGALNPKP